VPVESTGADGRSAEGRFSQELDPVCRRRRRRLPCNEEAGHKVSFRQLIGLSGGRNHVSTHLRVAHPYESLARFLVGLLFGTKRFFFEGRHTHSRGWLVRDPGDSGTGTPQPNEPEHSPSWAWISPFRPSPLGRISAANRQTA